MKIIPGEGTDTIRFGMSRDEIVRQLGEPESVRHYRDVAGYPQGRECLLYPRLDVLVTPAAGVINLTIDASDVCLWDFTGPDLTPAEATELIRSKGYEPELSPTDLYGNSTFPFPS
jgi:hypothetical protein